MSTGLPEIIDPIALCKQGVELTGEIPLNSMKRLETIVIDVVGDARVELYFSITDQAEKLITGRVAAVVVAECQRCLQPVQLDINCDVNLQLVVDEADIAELCDEREQLLLQDESGVELLEIVEDELLLGLPIVALHDESVCQISSTSSEPVDLSNKSNPFSALSSLKQPKE